jgi:hypothetical protein
LTAIARVFKEEQAFDVIIVKENGAQRWSPPNWAMRVPAPPAAAGAIVMAIGVFGAGALQRMPDAAGDLTKAVAVIVALVWAAIFAAIVLRAFCEGTVTHTASLVGGFAVGTWVAASAAVARMAMLAAPAELWLAKGALIVGAALWAWFIPRALRNIARLFVLLEIPANGLVLLSTVATQAVALMTLRLFGATPAFRSLALALMALGAACYPLGVFLVLRRYARSADWRLASDWDDSNCILHGALSITGLTASVSGRFDAAVITGLWICTGVLFLVVESIELARVVARLRLFGWRRGLLVYDVSQWARNFTFGMFYAFTLGFAERFDLAGRHPLLEAARRLVLDFGQYIVLLLLLAELLLMLRALLRHGGSGRPLPA